MSTDKGLEIGLKQANETVQTQHLVSDAPGAIAAAAALIQAGSVVAFPTDTVYGIGANAFDGDAVMRLFEVKERPFDKGIPILLAELDHIHQVARDIPDAAMAMIERFWPGPLTLIVPKRSDLPAIISPNDGIAVRIPDCDVARRVISAAGGAVAASSANRSGHAPAVSGIEALADLNGLIAAVIDNGISPGGVASTIVDCRGSTPRIVREGPISANMLSLATT